MKKRILSILLAFALCIGVFTYITNEVQAGTVTDNDIINAVLVVFNYNEGTYDSVNRNDNGALSIGKLQWHGQRALELMKDVVAADPAAAQRLLGESLYYEVTSAYSGAWNYRTLNQYEGTCFSALLDTDVSRNIQDALAKKDISTYISHGRTAGVRTAQAMVYYCDLENQYGPGGAGNLLTKIKNRLGKTSIDSLEELHNNLLQVTGNYHSRRNWVYGYCSSIDWDDLVLPSGNGGSVTYAPPPVPKNLDIQPPVIKDAHTQCLRSDMFRVEVEASDNIRVSDCRVEIGIQENSKALWAGYGSLSGETWSLDFTADGAYADTEQFYITVTVSDPSGNGSSTKLAVTRAEMLAVREPVKGACLRDGHRYTYLHTTQASCVLPGFRVEQCSECNKMHYIQVEPAKRHRFLIVSVAATCAHEGYIHYTCKDCDVETKEPTSPVTDHNWGEWRVNKSTGLMERSCIECGIIQPAAGFMDMQ